MIASCSNGPWQERRPRCVADPVVEELQSRRRALATRLDAVGAVQELDALKTDIGVLFKTVDQRIAELTAVRDDVLTLVERWKVLKASPVAPVPELIGARPTIHADHIGASTFIEKGWSRISLG